MTRFFTVSALLAGVCLAFATSAQAWPWRHQYYQQYNQPAQQQPAAAPQKQPAAQAQPAPAQKAQAPVTQRAPVAAQPWPAPAQRYSYGNGLPAGTAWPVYPNYGNPVGAAYSPAAGLRPGQFFGTFGLRPADARARGAY